MKKILIISLALIVLITLGVGIYNFVLKNNGAHIEDNEQTNSYDGVYTIDGQKITLKDGVSETEIAPGSASKLVTRYFGNDVSGDFNNDGKRDLAFLVTQETGGSGTFYYVVSQLSTENGYVGSQGVLLGDRIAPQSTEFMNGMIVVNFADRKSGESFAVEPSVGVSKYFKVIDGELSEIVPKLGEAEARAVAEKSCIKGGEALGTGSYNQITKTWWFDANLNSVKEGCNPACVVSEETRVTEINWRCTGLRENPIVEPTVFCTMDAKQCPDGSYVGRTGPNCEFVCPN